MAQSGEAEQTNTDVSQQVADRPGQTAPVPIPSGLQSTAQQPVPSDFTGWDKLAVKAGEPTPAGWKNMVSDTGHVAMLTPNGSKTGDVPLPNVQNARESGFHIAVPMTSPVGKKGWVPYSRISDAISSGFKHVNDKLASSADELANLTSMGMLPSFLKTQRGRELNAQLTAYIHELKTNPESRAQFMVGLIQPGEFGAGELLPELGQRIPKVDMEVPPETTTGKFDAAIKEGGAVPGGIQKGDPEIDLKDIVMFHDPATGSTLGLNPEHVSPENVRAQMRTSRAAYLKARPEQSEIVPQGHPLHIPEEKSPATIAEGADAFNAEHGKPPIEASVKPHDPEFAARVADAFDELKHNPDDPAVKTAYAAMKNDVRAQWDYATKKMGIKMEPWETSFDYKKSFDELKKEKEQPYANSKEMMDDVNKNHHLYFFQGGTMAPNHPLAEVDPETGYSYNDMLRAVHDLFGHAAHGFQFGPKGEENAYLVHRQMFSPEAIPALTTETRAQNSWFNYGAHLRNAEGKVIEKGEPGYVPPSKRPFAENKAALLPTEMQQAGPSAKPGEPSYVAPSADMFHMFASPEEQSAGYEPGKWNIPEHIKPIVKAIEASPAGAIDPRTGEPEPSGKGLHGVEVLPEARQRYADRPTDRDVVGFSQKNAALFAEHPELRLGWDYDPKNHPEAPWELNIGASGTPEGAATVGKRLDQRAAYDIDKGEDVPLGGKNQQTEFADYPLEQRLADLKGGKPKEKLITAERQTPLKESYEIEITDKPGGTPHTETVQAFSFQDAMKIAEKSFPGAYRKEIPRLPSGAAPSSKYSVPTGSHLSMPKSGDRTPIDTIHHELGHVMIGLKEGMHPQGMIRHTHVDAPKGLRAGVQWDTSTVMHAGRVRPDKVPGLVRNFMGGIAADENRGTLRTDNINFDIRRSGSDGERAYWILRSTGASHERALEIMNQAIDENKEYLNHPAIRSVVEENAPYREPDLSRQYHFSPERLNNMHAEAQRRMTTNEGIETFNNRAANAENAGGREKNVAGGKSAGAQEPGQAVSAEKGITTSEVLDRKVKRMTQPTVTGSTVKLMDNPLSIKGTGEGGAPTTVDVARTLSNYTNTKLGPLELGEAKPEHMVKRGARIAEDEAKYQLAQNNSGEDWYKSDMAEHDKQMQSIRPELKDPTKLSLFKWSEAVLSSGHKPSTNAKKALQNWDIYRETGKFSPLNANFDPSRPVSDDNRASWGPRNARSYGMAMDSLNRLIEEKGEKGAVDWLMTEHPLTELREQMSSSQTPVRGKATDMQPGYMILGAKRGPFGANLHGIETKFTADQWVSRTWNRWMGTVEVDPNTGEMRTDSPRNSTERNLMQQSFQIAADKLGKSLSSMQAILWYYEQALYTAHGVPKESWNFADAAKRVADEDRKVSSFNPEEMEEPEKSPLSFIKVRVPKGWKEK